MRVLVMFDLPVVTRLEKKLYSQFRKYLLHDGYDMVQYSVYCRLCNNAESAEKHMNRLEKNVPPNGSVRALVITEKQYGRMKLLLGDYSENEKEITSEQLTLF